MRGDWWKLAAILVVGAGCASARRPASAPRSEGAHPAARGFADVSAAQIKATRAYIAKTWDDLTRTLQDIPTAAVDPKLRLPSSQPYPVYVSAAAPIEDIAAHLRRVLAPAETARVALHKLPPSLAGLQSHGLLYLPEPYVVPGGRFNEMYGWDSYFIVLGLLRDGRIDLARKMTDNFLYEVQHYGTVLNANRTYYLTRSQPPLLSEMVRAVHAATGDRAWLARAFPSLEEFYRTWMTDPHLVAGVGLSRYFDRGEGPAPEVVASERDEHGATHYDRVREVFRTQPPTGVEVELYFDRQRNQLTPLFYRGDRAMRESGFDPTNRFGPFGAETTRIAPVCLNSLLFQMERDLAKIAKVLNLADQSRRYELAAQRRQQLVDQFLWNEEAGMYQDYDFEQRRQRTYVFGTMFYPLWAGLASARQAARVKDNLARLERAGGLLTSPYATGNQWDAPFGWAPLQLFAVEGLRRYGFHTEAQRVARAFASLVIRDFSTRGAIVEKYDVVSRHADVEHAIQFGYAENVVGFGWTNGVLLEFLNYIDERPVAARATPNGE